MTRLYTFISRRWPELTIAFWVVAVAVLIWTYGR